MLNFRGHIFRIGVSILLFIPALWGCEQEVLPVSGEQAIRFCATSVQAGGVQVKSTEELVIGDGDGKIPPPSHASDLIYQGSQVSIFGSWSSFLKCSNCNLENIPPTQTECPNCHTDLPEAKKTDIFHAMPLTCEAVTESQGQIVSSTWTYSPLKYWRSDGMYSFGAVFPANALMEFGTLGGKMVASYSMLAHDYDLMIASTDRIMGTENDTEVVNLNFRHLCSAVRFLFRKADASTRYFIDSFELQNLSAVGRLVVEGNQVEWDPAESQTASIYKWEATVGSGMDNRIEVPETYVEFAHISDTETTGKRSPTNWHYAIPQHIEEGGDEIEGSMAVLFTVNVGVETENRTSIATRLYLPTTEWEPDKMYIYTIQIQPSQAYITANVIPWDEYYLAADDIVF